MADVFLCKTGSISTMSRRELKRAGIIVVEADDPSACQFIKASEVVSGDDMLWAAMDALKRKKYPGYGDHGANAREQFALNLFELIDAAHNSPTTGST